MRPLRIGLVGDYDPKVIAHQAIPRALALASELAAVAAEPCWIHTARLATTTPLADADGIWCVPASPYANTAGALAAIRWARETGVPFLGTCGGFQHALLEAAISLWGLAAAAHAELDPGAADPVIASLSCSLVEVTGQLRFAPGSRLAAAYDRAEATEEYHCRFGLNPRYQARLDTGPLRATAWDPDGAVRGIELEEHPFFVATLFQPERAALAGAVPPLVLSFLQSVAARAGQTAKESMA